MSTSNVPAPVAPAREITPMEHVRQTLTRMESEFKAALPPQIPVERFIRTTLTAVQMNPDLLDTDRRSLLAGCMKAAQDGLLVDGREAALVIFKTKNGPMVQYMPMLGGILKKLRNSGELSSIAAHVVYENDQFEYELGDNEAIKHKPFLGRDRGKMIAAYAIAKTKDGSVWREVMSAAEIDAVRNVSRAKDFGPWSGPFASEMWRKTVLRRLAKRLPSSADVDQVFESDNEATGFVQQPRVEATITETPREPLSRLKASLAVTEENTNEHAGTGAAEATKAGPQGQDDDA